MIGADIKILFQEEVEMKPTSLVRSAEEDKVIYKNNCLQKESQQAQQVYFFFCVLGGRGGAGDLAGGLILKF